MAYKGYGKRDFVRSVSVVGISLAVLVIALLLIIGNIKKEVKQKVLSSGEFIATKMIEKVKETGIVTEMVPVKTETMVATPTAVTAEPTASDVSAFDPFAGKSDLSQETATTTAPAVEMKEVKVFKPDSQLFFVNNLQDNIGEAPKDNKNINYDNVANLAIWKVGKDGKIVNVIHSMDKYNQKDVYGLAEGETVTEDNVKDYFRQKIENDWLLKTLPTLEMDKYMVEDLDKVLKVKDREIIHAVKSFEVLGEKYVMDVQYDKNKGLIENTLTVKIQRVVIIGLVLYLLFLLVYSLIFDKNLLMHVIVFYFVIFTIYPLTWVVSLTFKTQNSLGGTNLNPIPKDGSLDNYRAAVLNLKKIKQEGVVLKDGKLFIEQGERMAGLEYKQTSNALSTFESDFGTLVGTPEYELIKSELVENDKKSYEAEQKFRAIETKAKLDGKKMSDYGDEYKNLRSDASLLSNSYSKLSSKIKKLANKLGNSDAKKAAIEYAVRMKKLSADFAKSGKDLKLVVKTENLKAIYNVFDPTQENLLEKAKARVVVEEEVEKTDYNGKTIEYVTNKYYVVIGNPDALDKNLDQVYNVEYYTEQDFLFVSGILNSIFVSVATAFVGMMLSSAAAYAFSRFKFPGREGFMMSFLITQMFPNIMMLIPLYIIFGNLGLINTFKGLILAYSITALPFNIWNLKGYFDTVPKDLEEAALIDGCSASQTFYKIVLPLSLPSLAISGLFSFMGAWNEYIIAATFMNEESKYTIPVVIKMLVSANDVNWPMFATMSVLVSIPVVIVFLMTQKYLVGGLTAGGVKG